MIIVEDNDNHSFIEFSNLNNTNINLEIQSDKPP